MHWRTLTYFGDSMLLIPTAVIIALILPWKSDNRRTVWYWLLAFGLAGLLVSLSKILFLGFGILSLIHISEPTRPVCSSRMPSSA